MKYDQSKINPAVNRSIQMRVLMILTAIIILVAIVAGCLNVATGGNSKNSNDGSAVNESTGVFGNVDAPDIEPDDTRASVAGSSGAVTRVRIAHTQTYYPYDFVNAAGESDGFEVQVMKAVDALLPDYEFEFVPTSDDDLLIGIESGKYHGGTKGAWFTEERALKYLFPQHYIGASIIGLAIRAENADVITDLESFARFSGKLVPIAPQNAQWAIVNQYNEANPDHPVKLVASESFAIADAYIWVLEGRYDGFFDIKLSFENNILAEDAPYGQFASQLTYVPYKAIPTWPLFHKNQNALAEAYDRAIVKLQADGTLAELSYQYFGEDIFAYIVG